MKKEQCITLITQTVEGMSHSFVKAGVKNVPRFLKSIEGLKTPALQSILKKLNKLAGNEHVQMQYAVGLLSQEMWDRYEMLGLTDLREQNILKDAIKTFRKGWYSIVKCNEKHEASDQDTTNN